MTEEQKAAAEAGKTTSSKTKERSVNSGGDRNNENSDFATLLDIDVTADYQAGQELVNRRLKAFGAGVRDQLSIVRDAMKDFTGGKFVIGEATYEPLALPSAQDPAVEPVDPKKSVLATLFGEMRVVENEG